MAWRWGFRPINFQHSEACRVLGRYGTQKVVQMDILLDFLVTITGLRVLLYGVVVTTIALGVLCMTALIVGYRER